MTDESVRREKLAATAALLAAEVSRLSGQLAESNTRMDRLATHNEALVRQSRKHTWWIYGGAVSLLLDVLLTVVIFVFYDQQANLLAAQKQTTDQLRRSVQNQCGLLGLFVGSYRPESRPPQDRDEYEAAFTLIRAQYRDLGCDSPIVPPAAPR